MKRRDDHVHIFLRYSSYFSAAYTDLKFLPEVWENI
jgi:hypothetical protein